MKKYVIAIMFLFSFFSFAQEIKFKKGLIVIDDKECLKYEDDQIVVTYKNLNDEDIVILKYLKDNNQELYCKVIFVDTKKELTRSSYIFTRKDLVSKLLKSGVIKECNLVENTIENFILKFDEKIEEKMKNEKRDVIIIKEEQNSQPKQGVTIGIGFKKIN